MSITVEAVYEAGFLKPDCELPLEERQRVTVILELKGTPSDRSNLIGNSYGLIGWNRTHEELEQIICRFWP